MSAHEATLTRICEFPGCTEEADVGSFCFFHARGQGPAPEKLEELKQSANGAEAQPVPASTSAPARPKTKPWTREEMMEAVQAFHARQGRVPAIGDLHSPLPGKATIDRYFGRLGTLIEAAGFTAPPRGRRKPGPAGKRSGAEPSGAGSAGSARGAAAAPPKSAPDTPSLVELAQAVEDAHQELIRARTAVDIAEIQVEKAKDRLREAVDRPFAGTPA